MDTSCRKVPTCVSPELLQLSRLTAISLVFRSSIELPPLLCSDVLFQLHLVIYSNHTDVLAFHVPSNRVQPPTPEPRSRMHNFVCFGRLYHNRVFGHPFLPLSSKTRWIGAFQVDNGVFGSLASGLEDAFTPVRSDCTVLSQESG
jgi:hypothetical protein